MIPDWVEFHKLWPLILIGMGIYTLSGAVNNAKWKDDLAQFTTFSEPAVNSEIPENKSTEETNPSTDDSTNKPI